MSKQEKLNSKELKVLYTLDANNVTNSTFDIEMVIKYLRFLESDFKDIKTLIMKIVSKNGYVDRLSYEMDSDASKYVANMTFKVLDYYDYWPEYFIKNVVEEVESARDSLSYKADQNLTVSVENLRCDIEKIVFAQDDDEENAIVMLLYTNN